MKKTIERQKDWNNDRMKERIIEWQKEWKNDKNNDRRAKEWKKE